MNLREKIEFLMARDGLKKSDLARLTNIPYTTIDSILKRDTFENVKFSTLKKLCNHFNVDMRYLCYDEITDPNHGKAATLPSAISANESRLLSIFREMNTEGQDRLLTYADDLVSSGKYKKSDEPKMVEKKA